jgi:hypothetical protein
MNSNRLRLGELLVESGVLSPENLQRALEIQKKRQLRLGMILLQEGFVNENNLIQALSRHLSIPWVSIWRLDIPEHVYNLVPAHVAEEHFLFPIYIRRPKDGEQQLYVGMNDPEDDDAMRFVAATAGMNVKPMIAAPSDIAAAIRYYYYNEEYIPDTAEKSAPRQLPEEDALPLGKVGPDGEMEDLSDHMTSVSIVPDAPRQESSEPPEHPVEIDVPMEEPVVEENATDEVEPFNSRESAQKEAERRIYGVGRKKATADFAITLLDGTKLSFGPSAPTGEHEELPMAQDEFIHTLNAAAQGTPVDGLLPSDLWQHYIAAIAKVLIDKGLISYAELYHAIEDVSTKR